MSQNTLLENLQINKQSWDQSAERFFGRTALPEYGPYAPKETELKLFGEIAGKRALEVGCGSGHSIAYMLNHGVEEIWGLDLSTVQIETAKRFVGDNDKVKLIESSMEVNPGIPLEYFDVVYSIYAIGWTLDLQKTLTNIHSYLKPGGIFIFSWENPIHSRVRYEDDHLVFYKSYNEEIAEPHEAWKPNPTIYINRKLSTYINELIQIGFMIERVVEENDIETIESTSSTKSWYSAAKADFFPASFIIKCRKI